MMCTGCQARGPQKDTEAAAKSEWGRKLALLVRSEIKKLALSGREREVMDMLLEADRYKRPKPSNVLIATTLGVTHNMPLTYLKNLEKKGWIRRFGHNKWKIGIL
jgi:DNA-binding CsgD family transcriptional regulator